MIPLGAASDKEPLLCSTILPHRSKDKQNACKTTFEPSRKASMQGGITVPPPLSEFAEELAAATPTPPTPYLGDNSFG